jgi:quercetin dioxygenase-like cupin family protein
MRYLITATDADGRSYIASSTERSGPVTEMATHEIYRGPSIPARPAAQALAQDLDAGPPTGETTWKVIEFPPGWGYPAHSSWSVDFSAVIEGSVDFGTDAETVTLGPGDAVLVDGVSHTWHTDGGCRMLVAMLGSERG